jgi:hypothetical protein
MSNFNFHSQAASAPDLAAKQAAFRALPPDQQARIIAEFDAAKVKAALLKTRIAEVLAARAIRTAQERSTPQ